MSLLLTLNRFLTFFYLLAVGTGKCTLWMVTFTNFIPISYVYLHVQQKKLSSHTKTGATGGGGDGRRGNNLIDLILGPFAFSSLVITNCTYNIKKKMHRRFAPCFLAHFKNQLLFALLSKETT